MDTAATLIWAVLLNSLLVQGRSWRDESGFEERVNSGSDQTAFTPWENKEEDGAKDGDSTEKLAIREQDIDLKSEKVSLQELNTLIGLSTSLSEIESNEDAKNKNDYGKNEALVNEIDNNKESKTNNLGRWATDLYRNSELELPRGNTDGISKEKSSTIEASNVELLMNTSALPDWTIGQYLKETPLNEGQQVDEVSNKDAVHFDPIGAIEEIITTSPENRHLQNFDSVEKLPFNNEPRVDPFLEEGILSESDENISSYDEDIRTTRMPDEQTTAQNERTLFHKQLIDENGGDIEEEYDMLKSYPIKMEVQTVSLENESNELYTQNLADNIQIKETRPANEINGLGISKLLSAVNTMNELGVGNVSNVHHGNSSGCQNNEIYVINKDKMLLVSNDGIARDISGLKDFEGNLLDQIENQDKIIKTLKSRLEIAEKQNRNVKSIMEVEKVNTDASKIELKETQDLLTFAKQKIKDLESAAMKKSKELLLVQKEVGKFKLEVADRDNTIEELKNQLNGVNAEKIKQLEEELDMCTNSELAVRKNLEKTKEANREATLCGERVEEFKNTDELKLLMSQIEDQDTTLQLLKEHIQEQTKTQSALDKIILNKDDIVKRLQEQVAAFLDNKNEELKGCEEKERLIKSQFTALENLRNMTNLQSEYAKSKDTALKILQNTVYQMVDKIPQCSEEAITGLRNEIFSLNAARGPLDKLIAGLKETLQAAEFVDKFEDAREQFSEYRKLIQTQNETIHTCQLQTANQAMTMRLHHTQPKDLDGLNMMECVYTTRTCAKFCSNNPTNNSKPDVTVKHLDGSRLTVDNTKDRLPEAVSASDGSAHHEKIEAVRAPHLHLLSGGM